MKLYVGAITAQKLLNSTTMMVSTEACALHAMNKQEAAGAAMEHAKERFIEPEYWNHQASVVNVPLRLLVSVDEDDGEEE